MFNDRRDQGENLEVPGNLHKDTRFTASDKKWGTQYYQTINFHALQQCPILTTKQLCEAGKKKSTSLRPASRSKPIIEAYCRAARSSKFTLPMVKPIFLNKLKQCAECYYYVHPQWKEGLEGVTNSKNELIIQAPLPQQFILEKNLHFGCPEISYRDFKHLVSGQTIETGNNQYVWKIKKNHLPNLRGFNFPHPIGARENLIPNRMKVCLVCAYDINKNKSEPIILKSDLRVVNFTRSETNESRE